MIAPPYKGVIAAPVYRGDWQVLPAGKAQYYRTVHGALGQSKTIHAYAVTPSKPPGPPVAQFSVGTVVQSGWWQGRLLVPVALLLLTLGLWLAAAQLRRVRPLAAARMPEAAAVAGREPLGAAAAPVALLGLTVFGVHPWTIAAVIAAVVIVGPVAAGRRGPGAARAGRVGRLGFMIAAHWQACAGVRPARALRPVLVDGPSRPCWPGPRRARSSPSLPGWCPGRSARTLRTRWPPDAELAGRVARLTETRGHAVDAAATELRRIERDLHDGAQARLVALGMNLRAVERVLPGQPAGRAGPGRRGAGDLAARPERPARPGPRHLPAGPRRPGPRPRGAGARPGHPAPDGPGHRPARPAERAGRVGLLLRGRGGPGQRGAALRGAPGAHPYAARGRACCGSRWPTTVRAGRTRPGAPACAAWNSGWPRSMASWP